MDKSFFASCLVIDWPYYFILFLIDKNRVKRYITLFIPRNLCKPRATLPGPPGGGRWGCWSMKWDQKLLKRLRYNDVETSSTGLCKDSYYYF